MKYSIIREDRESVFGKKTTIKKLKIIAKKYKIKKISKLKKKELQNKVFLHLNKMYSALKIQSFFKLLLLKKILRLQGPARIKRSLCTNDTDFYDLDKVTLLDWENFISFQDDGLILISKKLDNFNRDSLKIHEKIKIPISDGMKKYLKRHREKFERKN